MHLPKLLNKKLVLVLNIITLCVQVGLLYRLITFERYDSYEMDLRDLKNRITERDDRIEDLKYDITILKGDLKRKDHKIELLKMDLSGNSPSIDYRKDFLIHLMTDPQLFRHNYGNVIFSKSEIDKILKVNSKYLHLIKNPPSLSDKSKSILISHWKSFKQEPYLNDFSRNSLLSYCKIYGVPYKDKLFDILSRDFPSYRDALDFYREDTPLYKEILRRLFKDLDERLSENSNENAAILSFGLSLAIDEDKNSAINLMHKHIPKNRNGYFQSTGFYSVLDSLKLSKEDYRKVILAGKPFTCDVLNREITKSLNLTAIEIKKCENFFLRGNISILYENRNAEITDEQTKVFLKKKPFRYDLVSKDVLGRPKIIEFLRESHDEMRRSVLQNHKKISSKLFQRLPPTGFNCLDVFPPELYGDKEVLYSGLNVLPICSKQLPFDLFLDKNFFNRYQSSFESFRSRVEGYANGLRKRGKYNPYLTGIDKQFGRGFYFFNRKFIRFTPLNYMNREILNKNGNLRDILQKFPEDYFTLPKDIRKSVFNLANRADKTGFLPFLSTKFRR